MQNLQPILLINKSEKDAVLKEIEHRFPHMRAFGGPKPTQFEWGEHYPFLLEFTKEGDLAWSVSQVFRTAQEFINESEKSTCCHHHHCHKGM